jgi:hypothetical protein
MTEERDKTFLSRWSARKAAVRAAEDEGKPVAKPEPEAEKPLDLTALPSIEELGVDSDYTAFLHKGVPDAMRKAALRKLWVTEPSVVNYRPLVEYAWHDNEPGFGPLLPTDNVEELLNRIFNGSPAAEPPPEPQPVPADADTTPAALTEQETPPVMAAAEPSAEPQPDEQLLPAPPRRRHGGALPS